MKSKHISDLSGASYADSLLLTQPQSFLIQEAYRTLRTNVLFALPGSQCKCIGITSAAPGEGKSTTAINLAISLSQIGKKVVVIDCDMRLPTIAAKLQVPPKPGLSDYLVGQADLSQVIVPDPQASLHILPSGSLPPDPTGLLESAQMEQLFRSLRQTYDFAIIDLPPAVSMSDALIMSKYTDGLLLVVREQKTRHRAVRDMMHRLQLAGAKVIGFVVTGSKTEHAKNYTYSYQKKR